MSTMATDRTQHNLAQRGSRFQQNALYYAFSMVYDGDAPMGTLSTTQEQNPYQAACLDTPLGPMIALANEAGLRLLEFMDGHELDRAIKELQARAKIAIVPGSNDAIVSIQTELQGYFQGTLQHFQTPIQMQGSPFQQSVWQTLIHISYGQTRSYKEEAALLGNPKACRAVANANGANPISILVPCHRIIHHNGTLGGYGGGLQRKQWLLQHEKAFA